ncbi:MAG: DUF3302 domain-containing protein [Pseudomonadota bacterium]
MAEYIALAVIFFVVLTIAYAVIYIHDIPYKIAVERNHPHQDAIHVAGWISLLTLHVIWPFLWIWATVYREDRGYGFSDADRRVMEADHARFQALEARIAALEAELDQARATTRGKVEGDGEGAG